MLVSIARAGGSAMKSPKPKRAKPAPAATVAELLKTVVELRADQRQIRLELQTINSLLTALVGK